MNNLFKILVVEDSPEEREFAKSVLEDKADLIFVEDFGEFLDQDLSKYNGVLSDFYFPFGERKFEVYEMELRKGISKHILSYLDSQSHLKNNSIGLAVDLIITNFSLRDINHYFEIFGNDEVIKKIRPQIEQSYESLIYFKDIQNHVEEINSKKSLAPLGWQVYQDCKEKNIPCVIVTSEYHHGSKLQPFTDSINQYIDIVLPNGHKDWEAGFQKLGKNSK